MQTQDLGIDWNGPVPIDTDDNTTVVVDEIESPLNEADERALLAHLDALEVNSEDGWRSQFLFTKAFLNSSSA